MSTTHYVGVGVCKTGMGMDIHHKFSATTSLMPARLQFTVHSLNTFADMNFPFSIPASLFHKQIPRTLS